MAREVDVLAVLTARDRRVQRQQELLAAYRRPLVSFTMNIAGPVKRSALIDRGFALGLQRLEQQLQSVGASVLHRELVAEDTGNEAYLVVDLPAVQLKVLTVEVEELDELGRLFDMDVLDEGGTKLDRAQERRCLICGAAGRGCARSRRHNVAELQQRTREILRCALQQEERTRIGELACRALLYEACTSPKPGLVDRYDSGSHRDMDIFTFMASSASLQPYFARCAAIGQETAEELPQETFRALRLPGRLAEGAMLRSTGGVNTHKGAVFLMGLVCGALGRMDRNFWRQPERILDECALMVKGLTEEELAGGNNATAGQHFFDRYNVRGIRGEAEDGFPSIRQQGLPTLERALAEGKTLEQAGCEALLALMTAAEDTALLHRAGWDGWQETKRCAVQLLQEGVTDEKLRQWNGEMAEKHWSPGGSADLLSVCYLLHFLREEE